MAKLKDIIRPKQTIKKVGVYGAPVLKDTSKNKFLGEEGTKALVDEIIKRAVKATTLAGYGITDAKIENGTITLGNQTLTPYSLPTEGTAGTVLTKTADGATWQAPKYFEPANDGTANQVLTKTATGYEYKDLPVTDLGDYSTTEDIEEMLESYVNGGSYNSTGNKIEFKHDDDVLFDIDATPFLKDSFLEEVTLANGKLKFVWKTVNPNGTDTPKLTETEIAIGDVFTPDNYYSKEELDEILYGTDGTAGSVTGGIVKRIADLEAFKSTVKFGTEGDDTIQITIGETTKTVLTKHQDLTDYAKTEDVDKKLYGDGGSEASPAAGSIAANAKSAKETADSNKTKIEALEKDLYGETGSSAAPADGSIAKNAKDAKAKADTLEGKVNQLESTLNDLDTEFVTEDELKEALFGTGTTSGTATAGSVYGDINSLNSRVTAIENLDITEISASDVAGMFTAAAQG